jgi:hypothetical protein
VDARARACTSGVPTLAMRISTPSGELPGSESVCLIPAALLGIPRAVDGAGSSRPPGGLLLLLRAHREDRAGHKLAHHAGAEQRVMERECRQRRLPA